MIRALLIVPLVLGACRIPSTDDGGDGDGGGFFDDVLDGDEGNTQFGEEDDTGSSGGGCDEVSSEALALTDTTPWGVSVADVMATMEVSRTATARRFDASGSTTEVTVLGDATGTSARLIRREPRSGGADSGWSSCDDWLRFDGQMRITDTAGWFDETLSGTVEATGADTMSLSVEIESLHGNLALTDLIDDDEQVDAASLGNSWRGDTISGGLAMQYRSTGGGEGYVGAGQFIDW